MKVALMNYKYLCTHKSVLPISKLLPNVGVVLLQCFYFDSVLSVLSF